MVYTREQISAEFLKMELPEQVDVLEKWLADHGIEAISDLMALSLMGVSIDLDGGAYPSELIARVERLKEQMRSFNERRFGSGSTK